MFLLRQQNIREKYLSTLNKYCDYMFYNRCQRELNLDAQSHYEQLSIKKKDRVRTH